MKYGHLEMVKVKLRALGPVFIGSGQSFTKKEYILDTRQELIHFLDLSRFIVFLKERRLLPGYESFLLDQRAQDLQKFLNDNNVSPAEYGGFVSYTINAGEAVQNERFREVLTFIKDSQGYPYIPGSSLKGAVRTAIAAMMLAKGEWRREWRNIEQADDRVHPKKYLRWEAENLEKRIFQKLEYKDREGRIITNPINDLTRGIRISDSRPLDFENLTLAGKYDRKPEGDINSLPIFRECLAPGTEAHMTITLDLPVMKKAGLDLDGIKTALHHFADKHYENFEQYYAELPDDADISAQEGVDVILGGGAGFVSKTILYNLAENREKALQMTAKIMNKQFPPNHQHSKDVTFYKVSPHMLKTARYGGSNYQMGRCELIIQ